MESGSLEIHPTAVVCSEATLTGQVTVKQGTVIHPNVIIRASGGPIIIGEKNIIEETVLIENNVKDHVMVIGDENFFEVGCVVRASAIGNQNVFGVQSVVGSGVTVPDGCSISARCSILRHTTLPNCTSVYGEQNATRVAAQNPPTQTSLIDILRKVLPSYHHIYNKRPKQQQQQ